MSFRNLLTSSPMRCTIWVVYCLPLCVFIIACGRCSCPCRKGHGLITCLGMLARWEVFRRRCWLAYLHLFTLILTLFSPDILTVPCLWSFRSCPWFGKSWGTPRRWSFLTLCLLIRLTFLDLHVMILDHSRELFDYIFLFSILEHNPAQRRPLLFISKLLPNSAVTPLSKSFFPLLN